MPRTKDNKEQVSQPEYPDLTENLNSFPKYNTDSGYHGMSDADEMVSPDVQTESQASTQFSTQPLDQDEPMGMATQEIDVSVAPQPNDDSFHSAQENVRSRGESVKPENKDPTPTQGQNTAGNEPEPMETDTEPNPTPIKKHKLKSKSKATDKQEEPERKESPKPILRPEPSPAKTPMAPVPLSAKINGSHPEDKAMEDATEYPTKEETVLDNLDDMGSPSDGFTPERMPVRKSSLSFASLPAREPLKSLGGSRISRTSHIDPHEDEQRPR